MTIDVDALDRRAEALDHANWGNKVTWAFVNDCLAALRQQQEALRVAKLRHEDLVGDIRALQDNAQAMAKTFRELELSVHSRGAAVTELSEEVVRENIDK